MKSFFKYLITYCCFYAIILVKPAYGHTTQIAYCYDCNGNVTLYIATTGALEPNVNQRNYQYDIKIWVNGVLTTYAAMSENGTVANGHTGADANGWIENTSFANLPDCQGSRVLFGSCQNDQDWGIRYFPAMPRGVPIRIQVTNPANGNDNQLNPCGPGLNEMSNIAEFYIPINPIVVGGGNFCVNQTTKLSAHTTQFKNTIYQSNGTTKVTQVGGKNITNPVLSDTTHTIQWQQATSPTGPWSNIGGGTNQVLNLGVLNVLGTVYYQAIYLSSATTQVVAAHNDTIQQVKAKKPDGTDTILVPYQIIAVPTQTVYISAGGCPLTSNVVAVGTFVGPSAKAGTDTTVCSTAAVKQMGTTATAGWVYSWTPTTGLSNAAIANPTASLSAPGSIQYIVDVQNPACFVHAYDTAIITVNPIPTATITGATTVCLNTASPNITFTGANGTPPYTFTYKVNGGTNQTVSTSAAGSSTVIPISTATATSYTYNLVSVQESSSTACSQAQTGTVVVTVLPAPGATITGTATVCNGAALPSITFTGSSGTPPYKFTYNINNGSAQTITASGTTTTVAVPTNTVGVFTYSLTGIQDANLSACGAAVGSALITVNPLPTATITGASTVCLNTAAPIITFTGANGTPPYTFTYSINGTNKTVSTAAASSNTTIAVSTATATTYTYNLISAKDGSSAACTQAQTSTVLVTVLPAPTATVTGTTSVCNGATSPNIVFTAANGIAPYIFTYNINNGSAQTISSAGTTTTIAVPTNTVGAFTYSLTGIQDVNLSACGTANSTAMFIVNPLPTATVTGTTTLCKGASTATITFTGANATPPYTFTYNINGGVNQTISTSAASSSTTIAVSTATVGSYAYNLVSVKDGSSTACTQTLTATATVVINALPTASITGTSNRCLNDPNPDISFTGLGTTPPYTFTYSLSDGTTQTVNTATTSVLSNSVTVSAPTNVGGTFTYSLMSVQDGSSTGCSQTQTGSAVVTVNPMGASLVGTTTVCQNSTAPSVTFTGGGGTAPYIFTYNINGIATTTVTSDGVGTATVAAPTTNTGDYEYNLTTIQDNGGLSCVSVASVTVTVSKLPTASVSGTAMRCINGPSPNITFKGATTTGPYIFTYNISGGSNQTVTSLAGDSVNVPAPTTGAGTFTYNLVSVQDATTQTCLQSQTSSAVVTVNPLAAAIVGTTALCRNATSPNLTFTGSGGTSPYTFTYNINGGSAQTVTAAGTTTTIAVPTTTTGVYTYSVTSIQDGTSLSCVSPSDATVTVQELPTATIVGTTSVCENGTSPMVTFTGALGTASYTFTYNINGGTTQTVTTISGNSIDIPAPTNVTGPFTYSLLTVKESSAQTCSQSQTGGIVVTVNPNAVIALTSGAGTDAQSTCINVAITPITYSVSGGATSATVTPLPTGITASFANNVFTISGTPTAISTQTVSTSYTVTTIGTCTQTALTGTITVTPDATIALTSGMGTDAQTTCVNVAITPITYSVSGGATSATVTPLPAGITASFANDVFTISGTPTTISTQTVSTSYTVTTIGTCTQTALTGTITVTPNATIALTSGGGSDAQSTCVNVAITPITYSVSGAATSATVTPLPTGITTSFANNVFTISGTPTAISTQTVSTSYTVTTIGTCTQTALTGTITVTPDATIALTSGMGTDAQSTCVNVAITPITYSVSGGATSATVTPLPTGITASFANDVFTISGTPTAISTQTVSTSYTVTTIGTCTQTALTGTITVTPNATIVLTSGVGSDAQTICLNSPLTSITYSVSGGATSATVTTLPAGITGSFANNVFTISGTPTAISTQTVSTSYTVTTIGTCTQTALTGIITVDPLPQAAAGGNVTICENGSTTINGASSANGSILWTTGGAAGSIVSGTETTLRPKYIAATGDVNHPVTLMMTVTSTNSCAPKTATAIYTINVDPLPIANSISSNTICANSTVTVNGANHQNGNVVWSSNGAGAITAGPTTDTPTYTAALADGGMVVTLTMTVSSNNKCAPYNITATYPITINPVPTASIFGSVTVCQGENPGPAITFSVTSAGTVPPYTFTYQINGGNNQTQTASGNSVAVPVSTVNDGPYNYSLVSIQDSNSPACFNTQSGSAKVTVNKLPTATIDGATVKCQKDPSLPTITFTGLGGGTSQYTFIYTLTGSNGDQTTMSTNGSQGFVTAPTADSGTFIYQLKSVSYNKGKVCTNTQSPSVAVRINPLPTAVMTGGHDVCQDSLSPIITFKGAIGKTPYKFTFTVNGNNASIFSKNKNNSITLPVPTDKAGTYNYALVQVLDSLGCSQNITNNPIIPIVVHDNPSPSFNISPEVTTILDPTTTITNASLGADSYQWQFGDGKMSPSKDPQSHTYADTGHYKIKLLVINNFGCKDSTYETVIVEQPYLLYIPNTFSPNNDGVNDVFFARGDGISNFKMMIYDRWGNMIFYSDDINKGWDGKANGGSEVSVIDAYVYVITATDLKKHDHTYRGVVNLIK